MEYMKEKYWKEKEPEKQMVETDFFIVIYTEGFVGTQWFYLAVLWGLKRMHDNILLAGY